LAQPFRTTNKKVTDFVAHLLHLPQTKPNCAGQSVSGDSKMRTLQTAGSLARAAVVLLGLGFTTGIATAAERNAGGSLPGDDLTRYEIAAWHDKLYESTNALNAPGGGSSGLRGWAMMALAMFEASNTIDVLTSADIREGGTDLLRIIALTAMSTHDAHANHSFWKYHYRFGRPITQYRQVPADQPNGLGTLHDDAWLPILTTSPNPEYPSGHAARTAGLTASFRKAFGDNVTFRTISFSDPAAPPRTYTSFTALQDEVMISRTYGGVHWRHSGPAGRDMAQRVTDYIWSNYLQKIAATDAR
jgi:hypothetical protein